MRARLIRDARIKHYAGEIVEVSPAEFNFLVSVGSAVAVLGEEKAPTAETAVVTPVAPKKGRTKRK